MVPPKVEPMPNDFGLLPLPYTVSKIDQEENSTANKEYEGF